MTVPEQISEEDYKKSVLEKLEQNHIWLNKMIYLSPSDEQKILLAESVLDKLRQASTQLPSECITSDDEVMRELAQLTPILYLKVNWS
jgi:DNA-directed RNA polymerase subunit H (RpoH/RPB5)